MKLLAIHSPIARFFEFVFTLIVLNVFTVMCSLPVLTAGPAITALHRSVFSLRSGQSQIFRGYFKAFKENFRPALLLGIICLTMCISFALYVMLFDEMLAAGNILAWIAVIALGAVFFLPMTFLFPLLSQFENTAVRTLLNAFLLSIRHLGTAVAVLALQALPLILLLIQPLWFFISLPIWLFIGVAFTGWLTSYMFLRVFRGYANI